MFLDVLRRRNPAFLEAVIALHQDGRLPANAYALDLDAVRANARALRAGGMAVGHVGPRVQVPQAEAATAAALEPANWTVFSDDKAAEAAAASRAAGHEQPLLARIKAPGDVFYEGHEGGFDADDVVAVADRLDALDGARFTGITT